MLAGSSVGYKVLLMASLCHPCMSGSLCWLALPHQYFSKCSIGDLSVYWDEKIHSLEGDTGCGAETMFAFVVFTFHILHRTSDNVAASSSP